MRPSRPRIPRALTLALFAALLLGAANWQPAQADSIVHVVQPGENLFRIGLKYGVSWTAIVQANNLPNTTIYVGQRLIIPVDGVPAPAQSPAPQAAPASSTTYTIQRGDTLFRIATRYGLATAQLAAANGISNPSRIYAGQTLTIPAAGSITVSAPPGPKQIVIDLSEQHLYAYEGGGLVFSFVASTGQRGQETRAGNFSVLNKIPNAYGANWNIWMPNWMGIYWAGSLQNGIHGLPLLSNGARLWAGYLGTPVSYGCVVLGLDEAQALYTWAEVGTPVKIQY